MDAHDWRTVSASDMAPLYDAEVSRWQTRLHWDTRASWTLVEAARAAGTLPGVLVRDAHGAIRGWAFYLRHHDTLQIGAFAADSLAATSALLDAIACSAPAMSAAAFVLFAFSDAPGLLDELRARGFAAEPYRYLEAGLAAIPQAPSEGPHAAPWREGDQHAVAALLARAYPAHDPARSFARGGQWHEWAEYVAQLVTTTGCGTFLPELSLLLVDTPHPAPRTSHPAPRTAAATIMTRLSSDTVHLAQVVVAPDARGHGIARRLVAASLSAAADAGYARATLLVSERNHAARRVYAQLGFEDVAMFVSAVCDQPRRLTSAALETGGAITLR